MRVYVEWKLHYKKRYHNWPENSCFIIEEKQIYVYLHICLYLISKTQGVDSWHQ